VMNVASMAGFAPIPIKNIYSATKSAVIYFSYALRYQLKPKNISVSCLAPGPVYTKPEIVAETKKQLGKFGDMMALQPDRVGEVAVRKTIHGKMIIVPGFLANLMSQFLRIFPRRFSAALYDKLGKE
jgi:short-subunit dehydrogenase